MKRSRRAFVGPSANGRALLVELLHAFVWGMRAGIAFRYWGAALATSG